MDSTGREIIAIGKGLGFGQLPREITLSEIERTFYNIDLIGQNVMRDLPIEIVMFTAKILDIAANELPYELSPNAALLMADHISFAIERTKKRLRVKMPLSYDVRQMYPVEYKIGQYTVAKIRKEFHISLEREEIAGIAMNLVNAKVAPDAETEQGEVEQFEMMLEDITEIVERPSVKSCVSEIRQSQVWCRENSTECGLEPLLTHHPGGPDGMCAGGVNAVRFAGIF